MTVSLPSFLPEMLNLDGEWSEVLNKLYEFFEKDFVNKRVYCGTIPVYHDNRKLDGQKEEAFWHLVTEETGSGRVPDFDRAKKLPWAGPSIENHDKPEITSWYYLEGVGKLDSISGCSALIMQLF